jgi:glutathione S-transferase
MSTPALVLYDFPADPRLPGWSSFSSFVLQVERALNLAGLPFEHRHIDFLRIRQLNRVGQLPVLGIGDELVADSTQILQRIEQLVPGSMSGGLDARGVAEVWLWEEFADTALYPHLLATRWEDARGWAIVGPAFFGALPLGLRQLVAPLVRRRIRDTLRARDFLRAGVDAWLARLARVLDHLDARAPEQGFWLGPRATAADLGLFAHLHALRFPGTPWRAQEIAQRARLSSWLDRVDRATRARCAGA